VTDISQAPRSGATAVLPPAFSPEWTAPPPWNDPWAAPTASGFGPAGPPPAGSEPLPPAPPKRGRGIVLVLVAALIAALIGIGIGSRLGRDTTPTPVAASTPAIVPSPAATVPTPAPSTGATPTPATGGATADSAAVAAKVTPGIVDINTKLSYQSAAAAGTGMVLTSSGEILTNNHVVSGATTISVTIPSTGRTYSATVVGTDPTEDVAVLQLQGASGLKTIPLGDSSTVKAGDSVVAMGNAGGVGGAPSVVTGTVRAIGQTITASDVGGANAETLNGLIETNAPIAPGDSGGPLANASGQVVGMDTAASSARRFNAGATVSFAIPINHALSIAKQITAGQASATVHIGLPAFLGIALSGNATGSGAVITGVASGTPAEAAGLTAGDTITAVNGTSVTSAESLTTVMRTHRPGDKVTVTWTDQAGAGHSAKVTLGTGPAD
jgi:S1-C subfamily serine protease